MDSHKTNNLYERFAHLYRERNAPLESSKMPWGFQCENGWYKIIYEMSKKIEKLSSDSPHDCAITEVSRNEDGTLHVEARNLTPPIQDIIATAREQSRRQQQTAVIVAQRWVKAISKLKKLLLLRRRL